MQCCQLVAGRLTSIAQSTHARIYTLHMYICFSSKEHAMLPAGCWSPYRHCPIHACKNIHISTCTYVFPPRSMQCCQLVAGRLTGIAQSTHARIYTSPHVHMFFLQGACNAASWLLV